MSKLLVKSDKTLSKQLCITPASADWRYVGFSLHHLSEKQSVLIDSGSDEMLLVLVAGVASVTVNGETFSRLGKRLSPFEALPPHAIYLPPDTKAEVVAETALELAECRAADVEGRYPVRVISPESVTIMDRGEGTNRRQIHNILMLDQVAERLLVTEVFTPSGHWSSYPPHKHDTDDLPRESYLEETYYHRIEPAQGFVFQRVYTDDRSLDETMSVSNGDCVLVPKGYHPVGVPHGYSSYYLNVMAGPSRDWQFHNDPDHEWIVQKD